MEFRKDDAVVRRPVVAGCRRIKFTNVSLSVPIGDIKKRLEFSPYDNVSSHRSPSICTNRL
jgi:hypothetical protein